jgi:hypothetical protein
MEKKQYSLIFLTLFTPVLFKTFFSELINATSLLITIIFLMFIFLFSDNSQVNNDEYFYIKFKYLLSIFFLFVITLVTQNYYLNFETIEWDIASYLVASSEIGDGFIPNETQWESKGPIFLYLYYFFSSIVDNSHILFKILNDVILFILSVILFCTVHLKTKKVYPSLVASIFLLLLLSQAWAVSGYSELYSLIFISISYLLFETKPNSKKILFLIGLLIAFSTLVNQGTIIFLAPYVLLIFRKNVKFFFISVFPLAAGFLIPHIFFLILYVQRDLFDIYFATYYQIPLGYSKSNYANLYELKVFYRKYFDFNYYLYSSIFISSFLYLKNNIQEKEINKYISFLNLNILASLAFYFLADHNYYHHLFFFLYFISHFISKLLKRNEIILVTLFVTASLTLTIIEMWSTSYYNLTNYHEVSEEYPLYNLSQEIDSYFTDDYTILALDYLIILEYLQKPNYSYIVHPSNHFEDFIVETLISLEKIEENHISAMLNKQPDVIICNPRMIIRGDPTKIDSYNCEVDDYFKNYLELQTTLYERSDNLNFYYDPYKKIKVFIKMND